MNIVKGLYFPGTRQRGSSFYGLLCLLDQVEYYMVVEDIEGHPQESGSRSFWQGQVVTPLGADREKFQAMISDIMLYGAQYYENCLARLSAAAGFDPDETSVRQLASRLQEGKAGGPERLPAEKLWQARLVLRLAEILEEENAEIDRELAAAARNEVNLFRELKGGDEDSKGDGLLFGDDIEVKEGKQADFDKVLPAWSVLHMADGQERPFLVTDNADVASLIFDILEEVSGEAVRFLADFDLPFLGSIGDLENKRDELAESRRTFAEALQKIMAGEGAAGLGQLQEAAGFWQKNCEKGKRPGGRTLSLYLMPGKYSGMVWERISGLVFGKNWPSQILIGVLGEPS